MKDPHFLRSQYSDRTLDERKRWYSSVAEAYNRVRPRYAEAWIDRVVAIAQLLPNTRLLEVGCGPGTATVSFAKRGYSMVCLEPSQGAYQLALENCKTYPRVSVVNTTFEEWELAADQFDAVLAATSFHWVTPDVGYAKAAAALRDRGALILLWNTGMMPTDKINQVLEPVFQAYAPELAKYETHEQQLESLKTIGQALLDSNLFQDLILDHVLYETVYSVDDYLALLSTYSSYIALEIEQRDRLFEAMRYTLKEVFGGAIALSYRSVFQVMRRVCQIDCVKGKNSSWKAIAKLNGETVEGRFPIGNRHRPLLGNILNR
ncbi:MAG TPA: class I SAM-dependent methyltransferase, partial [Leptolyngbyaceae cyanobacterium M33_DOE_097]|nr:class I SAM-dependent methyltransferase [Leptolyngbyaceae cyanobacterium M33_DOE_097]